MTRLLAFTVVALVALAHLAVTPTFRTIVAGRPWWLPIDPN